VARSGSARHRADTCVGVAAVLRAITPVEEKGLREGERFLAAVGSMGRQIRVSGPWLRSAGGATSSGHLTCCSLSGGAVFGSVVRCPASSLGETRASS